MRGLKVPYDALRSEQARLREESAEHQRERATPTLRPGVCHEADGFAHLVPVLKRQSCGRVLRAEFPSHTAGGWPRLHAFEAIKPA